MTEFFQSPLQDEEMNYIKEVACNNLIISVDLNGYIYNSLNDRIILNSPASNKATGVLTNFSGFTAIQSLNCSFSLSSNVITGFEQFGYYKITTSINIPIELLQVYQFQITYQFGGSVPNLIADFTIPAGPAGLNYVSDTDLYLPFDNSTQLTSYKITMINPAVDPLNCGITIIIQKLI